MCTIAADEETRANALLGPVIMTKSARDPIGGVKRDELDAALDDASARRQMLGEYRLGFGLRDEQDERKARVGRSDVAQAADDHGSTFHVQFETSVRIAASDRRVAQPEQLQQLEAARLDAERARFATAIVKLVDNAKPCAEPLQLEGQCQPGRARPYDQHVEVAAARRQPRGCGSCA